MYVTECSIGKLQFNPQSLREEMIQRREDSRGNAAEQLRTIGGLCNSSQFDAATTHLPLEQQKMNGDATDQAVLRFSESLGSVSQLQSMWKKTFELAFNSKDKYMIRTLALASKKGLEYALPASEAAAFKPDDM